MNMNLPKNRSLFLALIILLLAAALRFFHYTGFSLSNDELSALVRVQFETFNELVEKGFYVDGHPGGIQTFLFYWVKIFGDSAASLRFPFVVMGVLAVWFSWLTARRWFGDTSALLIASSVAFLQFPLLFSQIARPYGAGLFFSMLTVYFWTRLIVDFEINGIRKYWDAGGYVIANVLMMYNHYFSFLLASIIGLTGLFMMKRYNWHLYLISGFLSALLFVPHIPITLNHLSIGGVGLWLGKPGFDWIFQHVFYIFNQSLWVIVAVGLISLIGFIGSRSDKRTRALRVIALMWFLTPIAIGFLYSRWVNPVLQDSVVIFSFPFLLFFLFSFTQVTLDKHRALIVALLGMVLLGSTLIEKKYYRTQHFGEFKDVAKNIAAWDQEFGDINITCAISVNNPYYIEYYLKRLQTNPKFMQYDNRGGSDLYRLKEILETSQTPYFVYAWTKSVPYETHDLIRYYYPYIVKHFDYADLSAVTLYAKETSASSSSDRPAFQVSNNFETNDLWSMKEQMLDTSIVFSGRHSILLNPENEFGPTFQAAAGDIQAREGCMIRVSLMVYTTTESSKATLVFSLEQWEQTPYIWITSSISNYARPNSWSPVFLTTPLNKLLSSRDILKVYLWNQGQEKIYLDDIRIDVDSQPMR